MHRLHRNEKVLEIFFYFGNSFVFYEPEVNLQERVFRPEYGKNSERKVRIQTHFFAVLCHSWNFQYYHVLLTQPELHLVNDESLFDNTKYLIQLHLLELLSDYRSKSSFPECFFYSHLLEKDNFSESNNFVLEILRKIMR